LVPTASAAVICGSAVSSGLITAAQAPHPTGPPYTEPSVNTICIIIHCVQKKTATFVFLRNSEKK